MQEADLAIVGAGAAGLAAAIFAAEAAPSCRIVLLERSATLGAKILISGGGRCNVTNAVVGPQDFNGTQPVIRNILAAFDEQATVRWFSSLGVVLKEEEHGKLFPSSDRARSVLDALVERCRALGVDILCRHRVDDIRHDAGFILQGESFALRGRRVIFASGGQSLPRTGSDGLGWEIVRRLGHTVTFTFPALVPLVLPVTFFHSRLSGVSHVVELSTFVDGKLADRRAGSLLFTHFGVSGPVVLDASRHWIEAREAGCKLALRCCFLPGEGFDDVEERMLDMVRQHPRKTLAGWLESIVSRRLAEALLESARVAPSLSFDRLSRAQRRDVVHTLVELSLPVVEARGWNYAEVTGGGVPLNEINFRTMESRKLPGLHLIGEMLDCDGRIGGFNFQWAWSTGFLAGRSVAKSLQAG